ncbi:MAG TPA: lipopolysaccharide heptosyltransferase II [Acidobacteriota bacterium]|nr:lipopolysaccharide heptosyltransferase II [Acidobacteriota bacterium]
MRGRWIVRLPTWLGDTVMAVPTIRALGRTVDELVLWGPESHGRLLQATGVRGRVLPHLPRSGIGRLLGLRRAVNDVARLAPTGALLLPNAFEPALVSALANVRRRIGYATELRGFLLTEAVSPTDALAPIHDASRYARLLEPLKAAPPRPEDVLLAPPANSRDRVRRLIEAKQPVLGIVPGCANGPAKRWPAASYGALASAAAQRWGALPVILGGPQDVGVAAQVDSSCDDHCVNLAGRTDLIDLAALLSHCRAVVSNDTGAAHLAAALSTPTLVLFGPTDPRRTRPLGPHLQIASVAAFCQPCLAKNCPIDHRCMTGLTTEQALDGLEPLWGG